MSKRAKQPTLNALWNQPLQLSAENTAAEEPSCSKTAPAVEERERDECIDQEEAASSSSDESSAEGNEIKYSSPCKDCVATLVSRKRGSHTMMRL